MQLLQRPTKYTYSSLFTESIYILLQSPTCFSRVWAIFRMKRSWNGNLWPLYVSS